MNSKMSESRKLLFKVLMVCAFSLLCMFGYEKNVYADVGGETLYLDDGEVDPSGTIHGKGFTPLFVNVDSTTDYEVTLPYQTMFIHSNGNPVTDWNSYSACKFVDALGSSTSLTGYVMMGVGSSGSWSLKIDKANFSAYDDNSGNVVYFEICNNSGVSVYNVPFNIIPVHDLDTDFALGIPNIYPNVVDGLPLIETYLGSADCNNAIKNYLNLSANVEWVITEHGDNFGYKIGEVDNHTATGGSDKDTAVVPMIWDTTQQYATFEFSVKAGGSTVKLGEARCDYHTVIDPDPVCTFDIDAYEADHITINPIEIVNAGNGNVGVDGDSILDYMIFNGDTAILSQLYTPAELPLKVSDVTGNDFKLAIINGWSLTDTADIVNSEYNTPDIVLSAVNYLARATTSHLKYVFTNTTYAPMFTNTEIENTKEVITYPTVGFDTAVTTLDVKPDEHSLIPFSAFESIFDVVVSNIDDLLLYDDNGHMTVTVANNSFMNWDSASDAFLAKKAGITNVTFEFENPVTHATVSHTVAVNIIPNVTIDPTKVPTIGTVFYNDTPNGIYDMNLSNFVTVVPTVTDYSAHLNVSSSADDVVSWEVDRNGNLLAFGKLCTLKAGTATITVTSAYDPTQTASFAVSVIPDIAVSGSYTGSSHEYSSGSTNINVNNGRILDSSFAATSTTPNIGDFDIDDLIEFDFGSNSNIDVEDTTTTGTQFVSKIFKLKNLTNYGTYPVKIYSKNPLTGARSIKLADFSIAYKASSMFDEIPNIEDFHHKDFLLADYVLLPSGATWADVQSDITCTGYDTNIVNVDMANNGKIVLKAVGETDMTVTTSRPDASLGGAATRTFHIKVKQIPVISVTDVPDSTIRYTGTYEFVTPFSSDIPGYEGWTATMTNNIVTVIENSDHSCKVVPSGVGSTNITLTNVFDKTKKTTFKVTIKPVITFDASIPAMTVAVNSTNYLPIVGTIQPATADIFNYLAWEPKNKLMLTIDDDNRRFTTKDSDLATSITVYDDTYSGAERENHKATFMVNITETATLSDLTDIDMYKGQILTYPKCSSDMDKVVWSVEGDDCVQLTNKHIVALSSGVAKLTASMVYDANQKKSCLIRVYAPVEKITFAKSGETYDVNDHIEVQTPIITPSDARIKKVLWSSSDPEVATIDSESGEITLIRDGTTTITVTATDGSNVKGSYGITITDAVFHEVIAIKASHNGKVVNAVDVAKDETVKLNYSIAPYNATNRNITVELINKDHPESEEDKNLTGVVSIGKANLKYGETIDITGKTEGNCKIKLKALDGSDTDAYVTIHVTGEIVDSIEFMESSKTLYTDDPEVPYYKNKVIGKPSTGVIPTLTYTSSNPEIASVDSSGRVTAKAKGTAKITATYHGTKKDLEADYVVEVIQSILVENLKFEKETDTINTGTKNYKNKLIITPSGATNPRIKYFTSNATVAGVDSATGVVSPVAPGEVTITAAANDGSGKVAFYKLTVKPIYVTSITFEKSILEISELDSKTHKNPVTIAPKDATNKQLRYTSSDNYVATVDSVTGAVSSVAAGQCTITAVAQDGSGAAGSFTVHVTEGECPAVKNIHWDNELQGLTWDSLEDKYAIGYTVKFDRKKSSKDKDDEDEGSDYIELDEPVLPVEQFGFTPTAGTSYGFKVWADYKGYRSSKATKGTVKLYRIQFYPGTAETTVTKGTGTDAKSEKKTVTPTGSMSPLWGGDNTDYTLPECAFYAKGFDFDGWAVNNGSPQPAGSTTHITGMTHVEATWKENEEAQKTSASGTGNGKTSEITSLDALHAYSKIGAFNDDFTTFTPLNYTELKDVPLREKLNHGMLANYCTSVLNNYFESKFTAACVDMAVVSPGSNIECPEVWKNGRRNIFWASPLAYASDTIFAIWYCDETKQLVYLPCEMLDEGEVTFRVPRVGWSSVISLWKLEDEETVKYFGADTHGIKGIAINMASKGLAYREGSEMSGISYDVNQGILPLWNKNGTLGVGNQNGGGQTNPESTTDDLFIDPFGPDGPNTDNPDNPVSERVAMPNVVGQYTAEEAENILREAGFTKITVLKLKVSDPSMDNHVKLTQPTAGAMVNTSDEVRVMVGSYMGGGDDGGYTPKNTSSSTEKTQ